jgi:hypothetical protein
MDFMIDPGHDLYTAGKGVPGMKEFEFNRAVVSYMKELLKQYEDVTTHLSHDLFDGVDTPLSVRTDLANKGKVKAFISVHADAFRNAAAKGETVFIYLKTGDSTLKLANAINEELKADMSISNRGVKRADFAVLRDTNMDSVLIEFGFMTNPEDLALLKSDAYRRKCAEMVVRALAKHYGLKKKVVAQSTPKPASQPSVVYEAHVQDIGWQGKKRNGETAGTTGQCKRLEALTVKLENTDAKLEMQGHLEGKGWTPVRTNGEIVGTMGEGLRLEAIAINCDKHTITYRVHIEGLGWTNWMKNGEGAGTTGKGLRIEAIEIKIV